MSDDLGAIVLARGPDTHLDEAALLDFARAHAEPTATPYRGVGRLPPGTTAEFRHPGADPVLTSSLGPGAWPRPTREGPETAQDYLTVFDRTVDELVTPDRPIAATMSAGLDSTFAVASLAHHATVDRPVHAFCHVPHPDAPLGPQGNWDPDESDLAALMEPATGGRVRLERVANLDRRQPLDVALDVAERTWAPVFNPANMIWITEMQRRAHALGAPVLFVAENGNAAYSADHPYALRDHLRHREWRQARTAWRRHRAEGLSPSRTARRYLAAPIVRAAQARLRRPPVDGMLDVLGTRNGPVRMPGLDRAAFERWLARQHGLSICMRGDADHAPILDVFTAAPVLDLAASMTPAEWGRYGPNRGYARHLAAGRVPDEVRLRRRRGAQSWDDWYAIHDQRDRYLDEVRALAATPVLTGRIDLAELEAEVAGWPWGEPGPRPAKLLPVDRILALAGFIRFTARRLRELDHPPAG